MIYVMCTDNNVPCGGVRKLHRLVEVFNAQGRPATLLHQNAGFRCTWFAHQTPTAYAISTRIQPDDFLVVPEIFGSHVPAIAPGVPKVLFNQNCYYTFLNWPLGQDPDRSAYRHPDVRAAVVVSEDSAGYLRYAFPGLPVHRVRYGIDPALYAYQPDKQPLVAFMPRKQAEDARQVLHLLKLRKALDGFTPLPIDNCTEAEAAAKLRSARVFLSFGHPEGFGLPPAEAMACGCITIGYHGNGGREFFTPEFAYPVAAGDILGFARTAEQVLEHCRHDPEGVANLAARASAFIHQRYSPNNEIADVERVWGPLTERPVR
jgi:hypothetical protein